MKIKKGYKNKVKTDPFVLKQSNDMVHGHFSQKFGHREMLDQSLYGTENLVLRSFRV